MASLRLALYVLLQVVTLLVPRPPLGFACVFPEYLQSGDGFGTEIMRQWHWHIMAGYHESAHAYTYVVKFEGKIMNVTVRGSSRKKRKDQPYTRECFQQVSPGRYIAIHREPEQQRDKFVCVQFLKRSDVVVQLRESRLKKRPDPTLCWDENLTLDRWPMVNRIDIFKAHIDCPLTDGFNMKIYDKVSGMGICDTFDGETRLESECMVGEGLFFRYRHENCIPTGIHMRTNQRTYCIANWQQGSYTFSIIRHDRLNHQWCFRFPTKHGSRFGATLFRNVYCDEEDFPSDSLDYLDLSITSDTPRPLNSLCMDDFDACNMWSNPCKHAGSVMHLTCARTCRICRDTRPATCTLPGRFHGRWLDTSDVGRHVVDISDMFVTEATFARMHCIHWQDGHSYGEPENYEQMLVTTFQNGCRPRYQCVQLQKRNPSILRYKLSQSQIWPFEETSGIIVDCSSFTYRDDDAPLRDRFRTRHFKTLISMSERIYVSCELPHIFEFTVIYADGTSCNGTLEQPPILSRTKMVMHLPRCAGKVEVQTFACLDSNRHGGYVSDQMIVTESQDTSSELLCWLLPAVPGDVFYLLPASQCNEGAKDKITGLQLSPIAIFHKHRPPPQVVVVQPKTGDQSPGADSGRDSAAAAAAGDHPGGSGLQNALKNAQEDAADGEVGLDNETAGKRVEEQSDKQRDKSPRSSPDEMSGGSGGRQSLSGACAILALLAGLCPSLGLIHRRAPG